MKLRPRTRLVLLLVLALLPLLCGLPNSLSAQDDTVSGDATGVESSATPSPSVPEAHRSARATMRSFLAAFDPAIEGGVQLDEATACLDLSDLPPSLAGNQGGNLATQLKDVIDRTVYVVFEEIPDDPQGEPFVFLDHAEGRIVIAPNDQGEWLFSPATVATIPELWQATQTQELVEGVTEAPRTLPLWLRAQMPEALQQRVFLLEHWQWIGLLLLAFVGVMLERLVTWVADRILLSYLRRRWQAVERFRGVTRPLGVVAMTLVWYFGVRLLSLPLWVLNPINWLVTPAIAAALVWLLYRLVDVAGAVFESRATTTASKLDDLLVPLFRKSAKLILIAFGLLFVLQQMGAQIGSLLAGLGLGGLAFALAAQDTVRNLFGSITVLLDRPFAVGDWVEVGGVEGTVEEVGMRSTRVRTFYNSLITLPNANLIETAVDNYGAREYRRWSTKLTITYNTPPEKVEAFCEGVRELIRRHPYTRKDVYHVYLNSFDSSSLSVLLYMFFKTPDWATELRERHRLAVDILRLAQSLGVEFAFPTQTVHLFKEEHPAADARLTQEGSLHEQVAHWEELARGEVGKIVDGTIGDTVPAPVQIDAPKQELRGSAGE